MPGRWGTQGYEGIAVACLMIERCQRDMVRRGMRASRSPDARWIVLHIM